jgi:hypothetical protein
MAKENNTTNPFRSATPNPVTFSNQIQDENYGKRQSVINHEAMRQQGCLVVDRVTVIPALPCWMRRGQTIFIKSDASVSTAYAAVRVMDRDGGDETTWRKVYGANISEVKATNNGSITDSVSFTYTFSEPTSKQVWMYLQMHTDYYFYDDAGKVIGYANRRTSIYYSVPVGTSKIKISADTVILKTVLVAFSEDTSNPILAPKAFRFTGRYEVDSLGLRAPVWEQLPIRTRFVRGKGQMALFDIQTGNTLNRVLPVSSVDSANSGYITTGRDGLNVLGSIVDTPNTNDLKVLIRKRCGNNHFYANTYNETRSSRVYAFMPIDAGTVLNKLREYIEDPVSNRKITSNYPMSFTSGYLYPQFVDIAIVRIGKNSRGNMSPYIQSSDRLYYRLQYDKGNGYWRFYRK